MCKFSSKLPICIHLHQWVKRFNKTAKKGSSALQAMAANLLLPQGLVVARKFTLECIQPVHRGKERQEKLQRSVLVLFQQNSYFGNSSWKSWVLVFLRDFGGSLHQEVWTPWLLQPVTLVSSDASDGIISQQEGCLSVIINRMFCSLTKKKLLIYLRFFTNTGMFDSQLQVYIFFFRCQASLARFSFCIFISTWHMQTKVFCLRKALTLNSQYIFKTDQQNTNFQIVF